MIRQGTSPTDLGPEAVRITDANYGLTADLYRCETCGFLQCPDMLDVLELYESMDDEEYEETREERALQARKIVSRIARFKPAGRLLDVGAGTGIMVDEASAKGFDAIGVEPSGPLQAVAEAQGIKVLHGVLPHPDVSGKFDIVASIDVIEHVPDPVDLLRQMVSVMSDDGICVLVTPDVGSLAARIMGARWWHYRIAHIGYFNTSTLERAMAAVGLKSISVSRPSWYFTADYLATRVLSYLPERLRPPVPGFLAKITVPLNLFDSLLVVGVKAER